MHAIRPRAENSDHRDETETTAESHHNTPKPTQKTFLNLCLKQEGEMRPVCRLSTPEQVKLLLPNRDNFFHNRVEPETGSY